MTLALPEAFVYGRRDSASRPTLAGAMIRMPPRVKKLVGLFILLPGIGAYLLAAMLIADRLPDFWFLKLLYFIVAGVAWAIPAHYLMRWMEKDASQNGK